MKNKYFLFSLFITTIFFLSIFSFTVNHRNNIGFIDKKIKDITSYFSYTIDLPISFFKKEVEKIKTYNKVYKEYNQLKEKVDKTDYMISKYNEALKIIDELESMLDLNTILLEKSYLNATVITRDLDYFNDTITIDKGYKNGINIGDAVVTKDGLVGKVMSVSPLTSDVRLLTSDDIHTKISVKIKVEEDYLYGLYTGYKDGYLMIEGISSNKEIKLDSEVTTTGLGDNFPSGILVGYVSNIEKDHFDLERTLKVKSKVKFESLSYVTVLKRGI